MNETKTEDGFTGLGTAENTDYLDPNGGLSQQFRQELKRITEEELKILDQNIKSSRPLHRDLFGIARQHCQLCREDCGGYEASTQLMPSSSITEFPSFCMHCGCPAHFHVVQQQDTKFPEDFAGLLNGQNIMSQDLNFNSVLAVFLIKEKDKASQNLTEISNLLVHSGIETVSLERRHLDLNEAVFLQSRIVNSTQKLMSAESITPLPRGSQIKMETTNQLLLNKISEVNPYLVERITRRQEQELLKTKDKHTSHLPIITPPQFKSPKKSGRSASNSKSPRASNPQGSPQVTQKQNITENSQANHLSPVREVAESVMSDDLERDISPFKAAAKENGDVSEVLHHNNLLTSKQKHWFMFGRTHNSSSYKKKRIVDTASHKDTQLEYLVAQIQQDPLLKDLIENEMLLAVLNSTQFQNLKDIISNTYKSSILSDGKNPLIYLSTNKIQGIEDCITFCPKLFKINKSIIVSEPSTSFKNFIAQRTDSVFLAGIERRQGQQVRKKINDLKLKVAQKFQPQIKLGDKKLKEDLATKVRKQEIQKYMNWYSISAPLHQSGVSDQKSVDEEPDWLQSIRKKEDQKRTYQMYNKDTVAIKQNNPILFNFGVMQDFFNYSGFSIQHSLDQTDLKKPPYPQGIRGGEIGLVNFQRMQSQPCNIFQVAKVGLSNLILPSTLDIKISNFENLESVLQISDIFFPQLGRDQQAVIVFRPLMVKNEINELFVRILRLNDFLILKRKVKVLSKQEIGYLFKKEKINHANAELYYNQMTVGPCEIVVVSKIGAVADAQTLMYGAAPTGRRRVNQLNESQSYRINVNAVEGLFEISPFSSFGEMFDLEDFMIRNSNIKKFKALATYNQLALNAVQSLPEREKQAKQFQTAQNLFDGKIQELRHEINHLVRNYNLAGYVSNSIEDVQQDIAVLASQLGELEEVILILNPRFNDLVEDSFELLIRSSFTILAHEYIELTKELVDSLFREKYGDEYVECEKLYEFLEQQAVHVFHLTKNAADRECRERFLQSNLVLGDLIQDKVMSTPLQPHQIPYMFFFMDLERAFEVGLKLLYEPQLLEFTGNDFGVKFDNGEVIKILQTCLITTVGDKIKVIAEDSKGNQQVMRLDKESEKQRDHFEPINTVEFLSESSAENRIEHLTLLQKTSLNETSLSIVYTVEAEKGGLFDIKLHKLAHLGDSNKYLQRANDSNEMAKEEALALFEQFTCLKFYYEEVNKSSLNICPSFYKFKITPIDEVINQNGDKLNRVFEVEEHMGDNFIEELAQMHYDHLKIIEHAQIGAIDSQPPQKSLPAYLQGQKLALMCKRLEEVKCHSGDNQIKGAGKIIYDPQISFLRGEMAKVTENSYYRLDRERYLNCLSNFRQGWDYYLSVLEIQIIEIKLMTILDSFTFKYSRQPKFLRVLPERLTSQNLKISKKISAGDDQPKNDSTLAILRKLDISNSKEQSEDAHVVSALKYFVQQGIKNRVNKELMNQGTTIQVEAALKKNKDSQKMLNIVKDCSISGFKAIGRRPQYHLAANILWFIDFELRKLERRPECFLGDRAANKNVLAQVELEYDQILDILKESFCKNYGDDETNLALDVLQMQRSYETEIEKHMRVKSEQQAKRLKAAQEAVDEERRKRRNCPEMQENLTDLIKTEVWDAIDEEQRRQREELRQFLDINRFKDADGSKFMKHLEESKIKFGPYALKVAEDYIHKQRLEQQLSKKAGGCAQEKISFVKMEYFLFGVVEADLLIEQLKYMEKRINQLMDEQDLLEQTLLDQRRASQTSRSKLNSQADTENEKQLQQTELSFAKKSNEVQGYRHQISMKETELLQVFRELEACDFHVPDHVFESQLDPSKAKSAEQYLIPMSTFWRPVLVDGETDPDLNQEKFQKTVNPMPKLNEQNFGEYLAPTIRQTLIQTKQDKLLQLQKGGIEPGLRPTETSHFAESVVFDKYGSLTDVKEAKLIEEQRKTIVNRNKREMIDHSLAFKNYF